MSNLNTNTNISLLLSYYSYFVYVTYPKHLRLMSLSSLIFYKVHSVQSEMHYIYIVDSYFRNSDLNFSTAFLKALSLLYNCTLLTYVNFKRIYDLPTAIYLLNYFDLEPLNCYSTYSLFNWICLITGKTSYLRCFMICSNLSNLFHTSIRIASS